MVIKKYGYKKYDLFKFVLIYIIINEYVTIANDMICITLTFFDFNFF
jgi:hypothetical protein